MKIEFQNTKSDLHAFQRYYYSRTPGIFVLIWTLLCVPVLLTMILSIFFSMGEELFSRPIYYIVLVLSDIAMLLLLRVLYVYQIARQNPEFFLEHKYEFTEEGIHIKNVNSSFFRTWNTIPKVGRSKHHTYIFVHKRAALIIPHRVLSSSDEIEQFQNRIDQYIKK